MKAVIMAGGKGTRLDPLTREIPKPLVSVLNKPVINYTVELLSEYGIREIAVTLQHMPELIIDGLNRDFPATEFYYFIEDTPLGTAGGVKNVGEFLDDTFIVISGDALTDLNVENMLSFHRAGNADVTVACKEVPDPSRYGAVCRDSFGRIFDFREKPAPGTCGACLVSGGIYMIEPRVLKTIPKNRVYDFARGLFPDMLERGSRLFAYPMREYWRDIGSVYTYFQANMDMLAAEGTAFYLGRGCAVGAGAGVHNSVVCDGARVGAGAALKNCVVLAGTEIAAGERLENCVVGRDFSVELNGAAAGDEVIQCRMQNAECRISDRVREGGIACGQGT
jgi:mannose-1-phosphate guanylyltransferase/phosphomannomutase